MFEVQENDMTKARLAQSAERKALNLVVVGSIPMVGVSIYEGNWSKPDPSPAGVFYQCLPPASVEI